MHLRGAGIGEAGIDAAGDERIEKMLRAGFAHILHALAFPQFAAWNRSNEDVAGYGCAVF